LVTFGKSFPIDPVLNSSITAKNRPRASIPTPRTASFPRNNEGVSLETENLAVLAAFVWHLRCGSKVILQKGARALDRRKPELERREWVRLPLAVPVFVRSRDQNGKDFLEFATALNISAGGALVAVHRALRPAAQVSLEIPSAPLAASAPVPKNSRNFRAKIVRVTHAEGYHLLGLKFSQALLSRVMSRAASQRKVASSV
jgi:PilZ domain